MIIELEKIGLLNPTRVKCNGRVLETQGLSVEQLVDLWRNYYDIPSYTIIYLRPTNDKLFNSLYFTSKYNKKPLAELFREVLDRQTVSMNIFMLLYCLLPVRRTLG